MRKLALLLGSLVVVASAAAKEVVPAPVVVEEAPVQIVEKEVIVYRDKEEGFKPNGNVNVEYRYFGDVENQDHGTWNKYKGDRGSNWSRTEIVGTVNMTENQKLYFRTRNTNSLSAHTEDGKGTVDSTQVRVRYFYDHGNLGDSKVNLTSAVWYQDSYDGSQKVEYHAGFNFAEYMFNNDFIKTTDFTVAPMVKYAWSNDNSDDYTASVGFYVNIDHQLPWGFSTNLELDGAQYNMYGQDQVNYTREGKVDNKWDDDFSVSVGLHLYQDTNLYSSEKLSIDWHSALGYDTYDWASEDNVLYGAEVENALGLKDDDGEVIEVSSRHEDASYEAYFSSDVTATYQATEFIKLYALAGAEYRNWAVSNENSATNWRWQPYVAAGFNVSF